MRVGLISDIHSNLPALEAVLEDMPEVDALVCAGDVVGYYTWPAACVDIVEERSILAVLGNHDRAVVTDSAFRFHGSARAGLEVAREDLDARHLEWLRSLPDDRVLFDGRLRVVHGHPRDPDRYTYPEEVDHRILDDEPVLVLGHTHVQFIKSVSGGVVINPGSVGQPRDGNSRAGYTIVDLETLEATEHRVEYPIDRTADAAKARGLPDGLADRLYEGR